MEMSLYCYMHKFHKTCAYYIKKYKRSNGKFETAWQRQQQEFENIPAPEQDMDAILGR